MPVMLLGARLAGCHSFARSFAATFSIVIAACKWENCVVYSLVYQYTSCPIDAKFSIGLATTFIPFSVICLFPVDYAWASSTKCVANWTSTSTVSGLHTIWSHLIWSAVCTSVHNLKFSKSNYSKFKWYTARTVSTDQLVSILQYITWMILYLLWSYYGWKQSKLHQTWSHFIVDILSCYIAYWDRQNECDKLQGK